MGIFSTRVNKEGAIAGILSGLLFTVGYIVFFVFISPELNTEEYWLLGISPKGIGTLGMVINVIVTYTVTLFTPSIPKGVKEMILNIRTPK